MNEAAGASGYRHLSKKGAAWSLGQRNAEAVYRQHIGRREIVLDRARELAELTIPSLVPPDGYQEGDKLYVPFQDIGSRCLNNLASKISLTILPPNRSPFRHMQPDELVDMFRKDAEQLQVKVEEIKSKTDLALSKREQMAKGRMETTAIRMVLGEAIKQLLVAGNVLYRHQDLDYPQVHRMDSYIVKRNNKGEPLLTILEEKVSYVDLDEDVRKAVDDYPSAEKDGREEWERTVKIYTVCKKQGDWWYTWQEVRGGYVIDGTEAKDPKDSPPLWPSWMIPMYGSNWGRSYADEYYSGFLAAENYSKALQEGAIAAAWTLFFTKPGSRTRPKQLKEARNLDVLVGSAEDITTMKLEKGSDFQLVTNALEAVERRLGFAFLLNSATQRAGERVTAEEIRLMARELDTAMGGIYAALAQNLQKTVIHRFLSLMEKEGVLPKLPDFGKASIKISIVTGIDALGRSYDDQLLDETIGEAANLFGPEAVAQRINVSEYFRRKAAAKAIDPEGLVRTEEEVAAEQQQNQMQQLTQSVAPGVAQEGVKGMVNDLMSQRQAEMQPPPTSEG